MKSCFIKVMSIVAAMSVCCITFATGAQAAKIKTFVSIVPQRYFVEKIGGDRVDVSVMVLPGNSPATYEPRPKQMVALSRASLYYAIGVPFEKVWLGKIAFENIKIHLVHTEEGVEKKPMKADMPDGIKDLHIWL
jgi:zinc transport system substrate-binding protein